MNYNTFTLTENSDGSVRCTIYKGFVIETEFYAAPWNEWFEAKIHQPIETADEADYNLQEARLELVCAVADEYASEGEAIVAAAAQIETMLANGQLADTWNA